jgi:tryptophan-rich sensory protein
MKKLFLYVFVSLGLGSLGSFFTRQSIPVWYAFLQKPSFNPPNYLFAPVWTALYIMLGIYYWRLSLMPSGPLTKKLKTVFLVQFALNLMWTPVFFGLRSILGGLILILAIDALTFWLLWLGFRHNKKSSALLVPYFLWLLFATLLNLKIYLLN